MIKAVKMCTCVPVYCFHKEPVLPMQRFTHLLGAPKFWQYYKEYYVEAENLKKELFCELEVVTTVLWFQEFG